jgi:hypothetical protein
MLLLKNYETRKNLGVVVNGLNQFCRAEEQNVTRYKYSNFAVERVAEKCAFTAALSEAGVLEI